MNKWKNMLEGMLSLMIKQESFHLFIFIAILIAKFLEIHNKK